MTEEIKRYIESFYYDSEKNIYFDNNELNYYIDRLFKKLEKGEVQVVEKKQENNQENSYTINEWVKHGIMLSFKAREAKLLEIGVFDKFQNRFSTLTEEDFRNLKIRAVFGAIAREGTFIGENTVIMPSFINLGAYIGSNCTIDIYSQIGSCAKIGNNCHISAGTVIAGVIEPINEFPVIIEDNVFIGGNCLISEGVIIKNGAVIAAGTSITSSTKIIDQETNTISYGCIPENSVAISGSINYQDNLSINCIIIKKKATNSTHKKIALNEIIHK